MPRSLFKQIFFKYLLSILNSVSPAQRELKSGALWLHSASAVPDSPPSGQILHFPLRKKNALQDARETSLKQWLKNDAITQTRFSDQEFLQEIESHI